MEIIHTRPPNFDEILAVFPKAISKDIVFAYNGKIYVPSKKPLSQAIIEHEKTHLIRQGKTKEDADRWWYNYLNDISFRYYEELLAHAAEYKAMTTCASRQHRRSALKETSKKLSAPLYNNMVSQKTAALQIKDVLRRV